MLTVTTPAVTNDLTILARLKVELNITDTASDGYLADVIREASDAVTRYCGRTTFNRETLAQTERLTCRRECIVLDRDILPAITSVTEGGTALTADEYELDGSLLYRLCGDVRICWATGKTTVLYATGYASLTDLPYDLERCALDLCVLIYGRRGRDPMLRSEKILDVIDSSWFEPGKIGFEGGLPIDIAQRLEPYRLYAIG